MRQAQTPPTTRPPLKGAVVVGGGSSVARFTRSGSNQGTIEQHGPGKVRAAITRPEGGTFPVEWTAARGYPCRPPSENFRAEVTGRATGTTPLRGGRADRRPADDDYSRGVVGSVWRLDAHDPQRCTPGRGEVGSRGFRTARREARCNRQTLGAASRPCRGRGGPGRRCACDGELGAILGPWRDSAGRCDQPGGRDRARLCAWVSSRPLQRVAEGCQNTRSRLDLDAGSSRALRRTDGETASAACLLGRLGLAGSGSGGAS